MRILVLAAILLQTTLFGAEFSFTQMSQEDRTQTGIEKLSPNEVATLENWITKRLENNSAPLETNASRIDSGIFSLKEIKDFGSIVVLADKVVYRIETTRLKRKVLKWEPGDLIIVSDMPQYRWVKLYNKRTMDKVTAFYVEKEPSE